MQDRSHLFRIDKDQFSTGALPVLLDTDIGDDIDDALALALLIQSPEIHLVGVSTVFGNTLVRAMLAYHVLHTYGRIYVPVVAGQARPLLLNQRPSGVPQAMILSDCQQCSAKHQHSYASGPDLIRKMARNYPYTLTLVCIGPLTNIATALQQDPQIRGMIREIVMMGGSSGAPFPEWNVRGDAQAAKVVLNSGIPITMIGFNVTTRCQLRDQDLEQFRESEDPRVQLLHRLIEIWQTHRPGWHPGRPFLHDPLTIAALCQPELFTFARRPVHVMIQRPFTGTMIPRIIGGSVVQAAIDLDASGARTWILQRLLKSTLSQATEVGDHRG